MQESESLHWWIILVWTVHSLQSHLMTNTVFMRDCMPIQITRYWLMLTMYYFPMWILTPSFFDSTHLSMIFQMFEISKNVRLTVITEKNIRTKYPGACSLEYHQVIRVFNICMLQWDCKNKRSKGRGHFWMGGCLRTSARGARSERVTFTLANMGGRIVHTSLQGFMECRPNYQKQITWSMLSLCWWSHEWNIFNKIELQSQMWLRGEVWQFGKQRL